MEDILKDNLKKLLSISIITKTMGWEGNKIDFVETGYSEILRFGYIEIKVSLEDDKEGSILFSPEGEEVYREIPKTKEWKENVLKLMLYEVD